MQGKLIIIFCLIQMVEKRGVDYLRDNGPLIHHDMHNVTRTDAELKYIRECSTSPGAHNLHFYRVRKKKTDKLCNTWLAICARGVEVYEVYIHNLFVLTSNNRMNKYIYFLQLLLWLFISLIIISLKIYFSQGFCVRLKT